MPTKKKKNQLRSRTKNKPVLVAHRGGNAAGADRENTLAAFKSASRLGFEYLETDVILSRDGRVIAYHGSRNWYWAHKTGLIRRRALEKMTGDQIRKNVSAGGKPLPLLSELLSELDNTNFQIDAKTDRVYKPLIDIIVSQGASDRVCITTFNPIRMKRIQAELNRRGVSAQTALIISPLAMSILRLTGLFYAYISIFKASLLGLPYKSINEGIVRSLHKRSRQVYVWTVNDEAQILKMYSIGVDGIISDEIKLLKSTISSL